MLKIDNLTYRYDPRKPDGVLDISFEIEKGEVLALLGPSGAGKTTLLNLLANNLKPQSGKISTQEELVLGFVGQHYIGDTDCTVFEYIDDALSHIDSAEKRENQIRSTLLQLELTNEIESNLSEISGGQLQRVMIARALAPNPNLIFFDEPFANLDLSLKSDLIEEILPLIREREITVIWTTHHFEEVMPYADRMLVINSGEVQALGTPEDLFFKPNNIFSAMFFGRNNILPGSVFGYPSELVTVRPCDIVMTDDGELQGRLISEEIRGPYKFVKVDFKEQELWIQLAPRKKAPELVKFQIDSENIHPLG